MTCSNGELGEVNKLMPMRRNAVDMVRPAVTGEVEWASEAMASAVLWYKWKESGKPMARAKALVGIQKGL